MHPSPHPHSPPTPPYSSSDGSVIIVLKIKVGYCVYHIKSYHIVSYRIISYHIVYRTISYHFITSHTTAKENSLFNHLPGAEHPYSSSLRQAGVGLPCLISPKGCFGYMRIDRVLIAGCKEFLLLRQQLLLPVCSCKWYNIALNMIGEYCPHTLQTNGTFTTQFTSCGQKKA